MNLNIEYWTRIVFIFVACFHPSHPTQGTCCQRVNCVDCWFWMSSIMLLWSMGLLGFVWLFVSPHSVFVCFGWPGLLSVWLAVTVRAAINLCYRWSALLINTCQCTYWVSVKPVGWMECFYQIFQCWLNHSAAKPLERCMIRSYILGSCTWIRKKKR